MVVMAVILLLSVVGFGIVFLRLHTLPERIAHRRHRLQFELVAVLGLISLFTHMHIFWIAGLLLAFIDLPDFGTPLNRIAGSAEKLAGLKPGEGAAAEPPTPVAHEMSHAHEERALPSPTHDRAGHGDAPTPAGAKPDLVSTKQKERAHA